MSNSRQQNDSPSRESQHEKNAMDMKNKTKGKEKEVSLAEMHT